MPTPITFRIGPVELTGQLNDSPTARALAILLPIKIRMARWGDEYYGALDKPLGVPEAADAREDMVVGALAYWPPGNALCLFFGPTPASTGGEPRAASRVNPLGTVSGDMKALRGLGRSVEVAVTRARAEASSWAAANAALPPVSWERLPRWRGFNLLEKFTADRTAAYREQDFDLLVTWGFDFVRLPMSYLCWSTGNPDTWLAMDEKVLRDIDQAVAFGRARGIHVNLNLHRAPGYCVNPPAEPHDLWTDARALDACAHHWAALSQRYRGIPNPQVSFDLLNEPPNIAEDVYAKVVRHLVAAIRSADPDRLIVADGLAWGTKPVHSLVELEVAQSTRGYNPMLLSHWKANWVKGSDQWPRPTWPIEGPDAWGRDRLTKEFIEPWKALAAKGIGVHVGEWGAFQHTAHGVVLAWMEDCLALWKEAGWGWSLWNFRGSFGILDSGRADVVYEDFQGHKLDRKMLELLRAN